MIGKGVSVQLALLMAVRLVTGVARSGAAQEKSPLTPILKEETAPQLQVYPGLGQPLPSTQEDLGELKTEVKTEILHILANSLALGVRPIASTYVNGFPMTEYLQGKVDGMESVGGVSDPNLEKILLLKPDLIITTSGLKAVYDQLTHIAPTAVLKLSSPPSSWKQQLSDVAQILGREEAEKKLMAVYWQRIEKLKQALGEQRHQMVISVANTSAEYGIWAYGENHPSGEVLKDVGFQRPSIQQGNVFYTDRISEEILFEIDGDVLFFVSWGRKDDQKTLEKLRQRPLWQHLKAVQNNKVYFVGSHWHGLDILAMNAILDDKRKKPRQGRRALMGKGKREMSDRSFNSVPLAKLLNQPVW